MTRRARRGAMAERVCAIEGCDAWAKRGSLHCAVHAQSALGKAAKRQLKDLAREIDKLSGISDPKARRRAEIRFSRKMELGRYAVLFSPELQELEEERRRNTELGIELGSVRLGLYRALTEIDDPSEMAKVIVRLTCGESAGGGGSGLNGSNGDRSRDDADERTVALDSGGEAGRFG